MDPNNPSDPIAISDDGFSSDYINAEATLSRMTDYDLCGMVGAIVAEFVNRGNDHETAIENVAVAASAGEQASRAFDMMVDA